MFVECCVVVDFFFFCTLYISVDMSFFTQVYMKYFFAQQAVSLLPAAVYNTVFVFTAVDI